MLAIKAQWPWSTVVLAWSSKYFMTGSLCISTFRIFLCFYFQMIRGEKQNGAAVKELIHPELETHKGLAWALSFACNKKNVPYSTHSMLLLWCQFKMVMFAPCFSQHIDFRQLQAHCMWALMSTWENSLFKFSQQSLPLFPPPISYFLEVFLFFNHPTALFQKMFVFLSCPPTASNICNVLYECVCVRMRESDYM